MGAQRPRWVRAAASRRLPGQCRMTIPGSGGQMYRISENGLDPEYEAPADPRESFNGHLGGITCYDLASPIRKGVTDPTVLDGLLSPGRLHPLPAPPPPPQPILPLWPPL